MFKVDQDFFAYAGMHGVTVVALKKGISISRPTWIRFVSGQGISGITKERILVFCEAQGLDVEEVSKRFFREEVSKEKQDKRVLEESLRVVIRRKVSRTVFNYTDLAGYLGVSRQLVYNFMKGDPLSLEKLEQVKSFLMMYDGK